MDFCGFNKKKSVPLAPPSEMPSALDALYVYYINKVRPIEEITAFNKITTPGYTYGEITGKPTILFLGPYSTGKTTMINYIINDTYKGSKIGAEPTTENFTVLTHGEEPKIIDSNAIICMEDHQFKQVEAFGTEFLNKFQQVEVRSEILKNMNIIDTPGIYENTDEEGTGLGYSYNKVLRYFCQRVEMIVLLFDINRLGSAIPMIMNLLHPFKEKVKIILNKADTLSPDNVLRVRENLLWQIAKVTKTQDIIKVYYGSYWNYEYTETFITTLIKEDQIQFEKDINECAKHYKTTRIGQIRKRAKKLCFYYYLHSFILKRHFRIKHKKHWAKYITNEEFSTIAKILVNDQITTEANIPPIEEWVNGVKNLTNIKQWQKVDKMLNAQLEEFINKDLNTIILCANQEPSPVWNLMLNRPRIFKYHYDSGSKRNIDLIQKKVLKTTQKNSKESSSQGSIEKNKKNQKKKLVPMIDNNNNLKSSLTEVKLSNTTTPNILKPFDKTATQKSISLHSKESTKKKEKNSIGITQTESIIKTNINDNGDIGGKK